MNEPSAEAQQLPLHSHSERVFTVPGFLSAAECSALIDLAEVTGFEAATVRTPEGQQSMQRVRNNERAMADAPIWVGRLWQRLRQVRLPLMGGEAAVGLPRQLRFYKYGPGQRFKMHKDGPWQEDGLSSRLTFLVYLNHGYTGGQTDFRDFVIEPVTGTALLFVHDTWHEGTALVEGVKYVLRSDVLYGPTQPRTITS